jgi:autotransporter-associated beta strand protein
MITNPAKPPVLPSIRIALATCIHALCLAGVLGLFQVASAATTIGSGSTVTVTDPVSWSEGAGAVTIDSGGTLYFVPTNQGTYSIGNALVLAGSGGTINLRFQKNDTIYTMTGPITSTATGPQTLSIVTGYSANGDREEVTFNSAIPNVGDGSALGLQVTFNTQSGSYSFVNLAGNNTFTGPITLVKGSNVNFGYLTIGGRGIGNNSNQYAVTPGSGTLNSGNYAGAISLGASTIFSYASSATQTLSGPISGAGALQVTGSGTLTLAGTNTYSGNTTVNSGKALVLADSGNYKFYITDAATNNKITGAGSATLNGIFTIDHSAVTATSGSWTLVNTTTKTFGGTFGLAGFTGPVGNIYTKSAAGQNWTFDKSTGVLSLSSQAIITAFGIPGSAGIINQTSKTIALTVPYGTSLATLAPTYTLTSGSCNPSSGSPPSPTFAVPNPAHYIATDGAITNDYTVTVSVTPASSAKDVLTCQFGALGSATISGTNILFTVPPGQSLSMAPTFTLSQFATISPLSGSTQDFSSPVIYTVTAQNGTTQAYTVTVQSYDTWAHSGSFFISTTPDGANIATGAAETNFPLLVRFNSTNFNFAEAESDGRDLRFTTAAGANLQYQIEQWDAANSVAAVWVKIPSIAANARQEIRMYWGKSGVASQSSGTNVFNAANGYASVIHMNETVSDSAGTLTPTNIGTTVANSLIGKGRTFIAGNGVNCGDNLTTLPSGNTAHSTQAWFRSGSSGFEIVDWSREDSGKKVQIRLLSPPHIYIDGNFASVTGTTSLAASQWHQVVHTYTPGTPGVSRIYVDGQLDASANVTMDIIPPSIMRIGGWYNNYNFVGDMDEVRLSKFTRSANWIKMEYENQRAQQTLIGGIVPPGSAFSVSPTSVTMNESTSTTLTAQAGGARKVYWIYLKNGQETVLATDQLSYTYTAPRITGSDSATIRFRAVFAAGPQTIDVPLTVLDTVPDPVFTLVPSTSSWDGRQTMTVTANISNLAAMQNAGFGTLNYKWSVSGVAVIKQTSNGTLTLTRSQGGGPMTASLTIDNGGTPVSNSIIINVQEPASDPWVQRAPDANEKPLTKQFFARDPATGLGTIHYRGTQAGATEVYLKVFTTDTGFDVPYATHRQALVSGAYSFAAPIAAGKVTYKVTYGTTSGGIDSAPLATVTDLVCGDAFIIEGQSNALATDNSAPNDTTTTNKWVRTYGLTSGWGYAISKGNDLQLGVWGWYLANRLVLNNNIPVCIINGAAGGTRIDQHRPNPAGRGTAGSLYSIYANLYNRVVGAKLTHGIRGLLWHQGEQNQGSGGIDPDYDYKFYQQYFVDISAAWKQDFPNLRNYYFFQIWPAACGDTTRNDQLREVQRTLPRLYSNMKMMSTHGIIPGSSCHYGPAGYQVFSDLIGPLVEQDVYGVNPTAKLTAPNLQQAYFTTPAKTEIALVFDQNVAWNPGAPTMLFLANSAGATSGTVSSGSATGNTIKLQVSGASSATSITYLKGLVSWQQANLIFGNNLIAALTFADVPIAPLSPYGTWANGTFAIAFTNTAATSDPDGDGQTNQQEFAFGLDPTTGSSANPITQQLNKTTGVFKYTRTANSGLTYKVYYSTNLSAWTLDASAIQSPATALAGVETVTVTLVAAAPSNGKLFVRVEATPTP